MFPAFCAAPRMSWKSGIAPATRRCAISNSDLSPRKSRSAARAENTIRHRHTNYDDMLAAAGGLLWPEVYERLRAGTDRIVRALASADVGKGGAA